MSTDRPSKGVLVFVCDVCDDSIEVTNEDTNDFRKCWRFAKAEGWVIFGREHRCANCAELS